MPTLFTFPFTTAPAATNMAQDLALLTEGLPAEGARLRFYGWAEAEAATFGYAQRQADAQTEARMLGLPPDSPLVRRPTGGGVVDHRHDLTYALAVGAGHPVAQGKATDFYQGLHRAWQQALDAHGIATRLHPCPKACGDTTPIPAASVCFRDFAPDDLTTPDGTHKLAGAALKRTRAGLLAQGSLDKRLLMNVDLTALQQSALQELAAWLGLEAQPKSDLPTFLPEEASRFASAAWNARR